MNNQPAPVLDVVIKVTDAMVTIVMDKYKLTDKSQITYEMVMDSFGDVVKDKRVISTQTEEDK